MVQRDETDSPAGAEGELFLSRWSRRKRAVRDESDAPVAESAPDSTPAAPPELPEAAEPPALTDADMPSIESLDETSDYSGFLSPGVSRDLRGAALRKLFSSAVFNVVDGLDDYAEDFTTFEPLGDVVTADAAGQRAREALERERAAEAARAAEAVADADGPGHPAPEHSSGAAEALEESTREPEVAPGEPHLLEADAGEVGAGADTVAAGATETGPKEQDPPAA